MNIIRNISIFVVLSYISGHAIAGCMNATVGSLQSSETLNRAEVVAER
ncbi:hypothetical protein AHIS1_p015 [Acaryochloris phage A-HIS1]|nr:hypothetical protein AHIS1_p015 [Acaryochloris phage A-HIS1]